MPSFQDVFEGNRYAPIVERLCPYLSIPDVYALKAAGIQSEQFRKHLLRKPLNINTRLRPFFSNPSEFRQRLGNHGALISGIFALSFFELAANEHSVLDVYIKDGAGANEIASYLCKSEEYVFEQEDRARENFRVVESYVRAVNHLQPVRVRIMRTFNSPIQAIILTACTTASMNCISWNKAYSMFPRETLIQHKCYPTRPLDDAFGEVLLEYRRQGWTGRDFQWPHLTQVSLNSVRGCRRVGDQFSLILDLNADDLREPPIPDFVLEHAQFKMSENPGIQHLLVKAVEFKSPVLQYRFLYGEKTWLDHVKGRVHQVTMMELFKLRPEERSQEVTNVLHDRRNAPSFAPFRAVRERSPNVENIPDFSSQLSDFTKPQTWDYVDDQIPKWYGEWVKDRSAPQQMPFSVGHWNG